MTEEAHPCNWPGCGEMVLKRAWACNLHWARLPNLFRHNIQRAHDTGDKEMWLVHSGVAVDWIKATQKVAA